MDLNEMRKKFRERNTQDSNINAPIQVSSPTSAIDILTEQKSIKAGKISSLSAANNEVENPVNNPAKSGESSSVSVCDDLSYSYERGSNIVSFSCSRIDNNSDETTGLLSLCCWISEKTLDGDDWENDNYAFIDSEDLGTLEKDYGFLNVCHNFEIPENILSIIEELNKEGDEWHFVFTINELHEDGNAYIIYTINGSNENGEIELNTVDNEEQPIFSKIKEIIAEKLCVDDDCIIKEASFVDDLGADSLDTVELIMEFENEFGITIPDEQASQVQTIGDAVLLIEKIKRN